MNNISWFAQRIGEFWEALRDLLDEKKYDGRHGRVKSITSQNVLLPLRGLSDEQHTDILNRVRGGLDWKSAGALANRVKMMACTKVRIMNEIKARNEEMPDAVLANWSEYVKRYPLATESKWWGKWVESLKNDRWDESRQFPQPLCKLFFDRYASDSKGLDEMKLQVNNIVDLYLFCFS
jgi:hypothetical protein